MSTPLSPEARAILNAAARKPWEQEGPYCLVGADLKASGYGDGEPPRDPALRKPYWRSAIHRAEAIAYAVNNFAKVEAGLAVVMEWVKDREDVNYEGTGPNDAMSLGQEIREAMARVEGKTTQC